MDNITSGFRERDIWLAPWFSTTLGSKLDSIYSAALCYLTITCFTFAAVIFFYTSSYDKQSYMTPRALIYVVIAAAIVTCFVTVFHTAMRLIRVGAGDFAERYSPVLLRDMSASLHVHWDLNADKNDLDSSPTVRKPVGNTQRNNSNPERPLREKNRPALSSHHVVSDDGQFNNNNRSRGDIFQAFPSSNFRMQDDTKSCFASSGDVCAIRDNFCKPRFAADNFLPPGKASTSPCGPSVPGPSFNYKPKPTTPFGSWRALTRSNSGFGACKSPAAGAKGTTRLYDSYLDVPGSCGLSTGSCAGSQRNPCLKNTNSDLDCPVFPQGLSTSTGPGPAPSARSVAFKCPVGGDDDSCSKYFTKPTNSDNNRIICGTSLPRSDDWKIPMSNPGANDTRFSSRSFGASSRVKTNDNKIFRSRCAYDDNCWGLDDTMPKEDYTERSFCRGMAATKKFSFPKQTEGFPPVDRFCSSRVASDPCYGLIPTLSPSLQKTIARMGNDPCARQTREGAEQNAGNFQNVNCMPCDFQIPDCDRRQGDAVERSWNDLWNRVKPRGDGSGPSKCDPCAAGGGRTSPDVSGPIMAEMRGFAGNLVENIIAKIKNQLKSPDQCVDLADCELDIESFVRRMSQRMMGPGPADFRCGKSDPCDDVCATRFPDCSGAPDPLTDRIAQTVTDGALKTSLAMLDDRVASIVKDVEKVRLNIIERMRQELGLGPEDEGKEFRSAVRPGMSASDTSVMMPKAKPPDKFGASYLPRDDISPAMTNAKLNKVARSSLENVLNRDGMDSIRDNTKATAESDLKTFANDVVQSLYMAVRTKLQQMLKHEYDLADDGIVPFPTEELLKKADLEVQEQVLPTVVEHIVWLMKEEAKVMGQLDCDMMMIAFAGQYVDTIVTNAVLKTHVDLTQKRAYTRTFVVTSNSNKTNSNNNNLGSVLDRCLSETTLSMQTLASLNATRLEVEEVLRETCAYGTVDAEMAQLQILCSLVEKFITRLRGVRGDTTRSESAVQRVGDADRENGKDEEEECPYCRAEGAQSVVARCLTPISAKLITDLILEEATKNLDACGKIVESNLVRCNQETMVALGRALLDGSSKSGDHLLILESVTADLKAVALDQATTKVVDDLLAIGDASRAEAERELRRRLDRFTDDAKKKTEKMMMTTAIRENHQQNNSHFEVSL